jgi:hypothetical protein
MVISKPIKTQPIINPDQRYVFLAGLTLKLSMIALTQSPDNYQVRSSVVMVLCTSDLGMNQHSARAPTDVESPTPMTALWTHHNLAQNTWFFARSRLINERAISQSYGQRIRTTEQMGIPHFTNPSLQKRPVYHGKSTDWNKGTNCQRCETVSRDCVYNETLINTENCYII